MKNRVRGLCLEGDVYRQHRRVVAKLLRKLGVETANLEDAVHDTFVTVYRRWNNFEGRSTRQTWILGIAVHTARSYRRWNKRVFNETEIPVGENELQCLSRSVDPHCSAALQQELALVASLVEELPHRWRRLVVEACVREKGVKTTAAAMAMSPHAAERMLAKARIRLRHGLRKLQA